MIKLRRKDHSGISKRAECNQPQREARGPGQKMDVEVQMLYFEDSGRAPKPRNVSGL